jgi:hypothetical protein
MREGGRRKNYIGIRTEAANLAHQEGANSLGARLAGLVGGVRRLIGKLI